MSEQSKTAIIIAIITAIIGPLAVYYFTHTPTPSPVPVVHPVTDSIVDVRHDSRISFNDNSCLVRLSENDKVTIEVDFSKDSLENRVDVLNSKRERIAVLDNQFSQSYETFGFSGNTFTYKNELGTETTLTFSLYNKDGKAGDDGLQYKPWLKQSIDVIKNTNSDFVIVGTENKEYPYTTTAIKLSIEKYLAD